MHLLVNLHIVNALFIDNISGSEENYSTRTNFDLLTKVFRLISSKNGMIGLQRSLQTMLSIASPSFASLLVFLLSHSATALYSFPQILLKLTGSGIGPQNMLNMKFLFTTPVLKHS